MFNKSNIIYCTAKEFFRGYPFEVIKIISEKYTQKMHYHDYMQIWYVKKGPCIHYLNGVKYDLSSGDIVVIPPNIPHRIVSVGNRRVELIGCGFLENFIYDPNDECLNYLRPFIAEPDKINPYFSLNGIALKKVESVLDEIMVEYRRKNEFFEYFIKSDIQRILSILAREHIKCSQNDANISKYREKVTEILEYLKVHYKERIYINDVCEMIGLSPAYFSYIFKHITGRTFTEYLRFLKIEKAKEILLNNPENKSIGEISAELGFEDHGYFDRVFKNEVGISPKKYKTFYDSF